MTRLALAALLLFAGCSSVPAGTPNATSYGGQENPGATFAEVAVTRHGSGSGDSARFTLTGGDYAISWAVRLPTGTSSCFAGLNLQGTGYIRSIVSARISGNTMNVMAINDVPPGSYYIGASSSCPWDVGVQPYR